MADLRPQPQQDARRGSFLQEWKRQSQVFWDEEGSEGDDDEPGEEAANAEESASEIASDDEHEQYEGQSEDETNEVTM